MHAGFILWQMQERRWKALAKTVLSGFG